MKHSFLGLLLAAALLTGCSVTPLTAKEATQAAACIMKSASDTQRTALGTRAALSQPFAVEAGDVGGCGVKMAVWLSEDNGRAVGAELVKLLPAYRAARQGLYAGGIGKTLSAEQQAVIGELGIALEDAAVAARQLLACTDTRPEIVSALGDMNLPFATATLGVRANIGDPVRAQAMAQQTIATVALLMQQTPEIKCESNDGKNDFQGYAKQMQAFYKGEHPWAPGCGIEQDAEGLKLVCTGTTAKRP